MCFHLSRKLFFTSIWRAVLPVSYTHLDVYKRQMEQYAANCIQAYQSAREEKLAVIICIPNFYDRIGLSALLEKIIEEGCDGIAVMNYNKKNEACLLYTSRCV